MASRTRAHIKLLPGGYLIEWNDDPFAHKEVLCHTREEMLMRLGRLFEEAEGRKVEACDRCDGRGFLDGGGFMYGDERPCPKCHTTGEQEKQEG